ncbi:MAG: ABC transporter ATP-binding protein [Candidatus Bathyarchaeota archaeon]|nr:MAG: ABC transporter ATP-binding protein [Candidatus Bathyarchaeota archaeon]
MIELVDVSKTYGDVEALIEVNLEVASGELLTLLGPNGSGKSTLLRILAGLETPTEGQVLYEGAPINAGSLQELRGRATMIFQRTVLLRGSVYDNVAYGLQFTKKTGAEVKEGVERALSLVGLSPLKDRRAKALSGGEQQRLSLARALVLNRDLLLLDEPTANLDPESLGIVKEVINRLNKEKGKTIVMASHNLAQVQEASGRLLLLNEGRIEEEGRTRELLSNQSAVMRRFTRSENVFAGDSLVVNGVSHVDIGEGTTVRAAFIREGRAIVHVPPEDIIVSHMPMESSARNSLRGRIVSIEDRDSVVRLRVDAGRVFSIQITRRSLEEMALNVGVEVYLTFKASSVQIL